MPEAYFNFKVVYYCALPNNEIRFCRDRVSCITENIYSGVDSLNTMFPSDTLLVPVPYEVALHVGMITKETYVEALGITKELKAVAALVNKL